MESSQESATENLALARVGDSDSVTRKVNVKVEGSDSADGPDGDIAKVDVEVKQEVPDKDGLGSGKDAENEIDNGNGPVNQTEVVLVEDIKQEEVELEEDNDGLGIENQGNSGVQENADQENGVQENVVQENLDNENGFQEHMVPEDGVQEVGAHEMNVDGEKSDDSDVGEEGHEFGVGDFVWGKVKNYPWWPGQIYDPSYASDNAEKNRIGKGSFLVAYFGDGSFSWCRKSQLKKFTDNFDEFSRESNSKKFLDAIMEALDEFSRFLDVEISSMCVHLENRIWEFKAKNSGIKAGVSVPRGDYLKLFLAKLEPEQLLGTLRLASKTGSVASPLELRVLKCWMAAFYHRKRGYELVEFHEPITIEELEDKMGNGVNGEVDIDDAMEEDIVSEDKVSQRKQKMDGGQDGKWDISSVKMSSGKRGRKKKAESVKNSDLEKVEMDSKEETLESFVSRERKKSKYLSSPYTPPKRATNLKMGERMTRVAGQLFGSSPSLTSFSNQSNKNRSNQVDIDIDVTEVLFVITESAIDPLHSRGKKNLDQIKEFVSAYRSSGNLDGSKKLFDVEKISEESDGDKDLGLITEKLEKLISEVKSWDGQVTARKKRKLEGELKDLVAEVSVLPESSP